MRVRFSLIRLVLVASALSVVQPAGAIILFGLDNSANQTDPGTGVAFDSVGLLSNAGKASPQGSAIHLGGGYMLTAEHVGMRPFVTFDGTTFYQRDLAFTPLQVAANVDLQIFKLTTTPTVAAANLYNGSDELTASATMVGWGKGRDPAVPVNTLNVTWGNDSTIAKRWGVNLPLGFDTVGHEAGSYDAILTGLGSGSGSPAGLGASEAAATLYDSGSGLFQNHGGTWYLIGLTTGVETFGTSKFGNDQLADPHGDLNAFVQISSYHDDILDLIPEPSALGLLACSVVVLLGFRVRAPVGSD